MNSRLKKKSNHRNIQSKYRYSLPNSILFSMMNEEKKKEKKWFDPGTESIPDLEAVRNKNHWLSSIFQKSTSNFLREKKNFPREFRACLFFSHVQPSSLRAVVIIEVTRRVSRRSAHLSAARQWTMGRADSHSWTPRWGSAKDGIRGVRQAATKERGAEEAIYQAASRAIYPCEKASS